MRTLSYLSPTAISQWQTDQQEYYLRYLAEERPDKFPQTQPMAVGSAFDAYIKSHLSGRLFGPSASPDFKFETIFEKQVEPQNRDWALTAGKHCFESYKQSGALADLLLDLQQAKSEPRFEFEVQANVSDGGPFVPLLGKPDVWFQNKDGGHVILDWKVNGYMSRSPVSPAPGYIRVRDGWISGKSSKKHPDAVVMSHKGMLINVAQYLEDANPDWANQLAIYAWIMGEPVGGDFIVAIDQLCCRPVIGNFSGSCAPQVRVAEHRTRIKPDFQIKLFAVIKKMWEIVNSEHIFRDLSVEDSKAKCSLLDKTASTLADEEPWLRDMLRAAPPRW